MQGPLVEPEPLKTAADLLGNGFWAYSKTEQTFSFSNRARVLLGLENGHTTVAGVLADEDLRRLRRNISLNERFEMVVDLPETGERVLIQGWPEDFRPIRIVGTIIPLPKDAAPKDAAADPLLLEAMEHGPDSMLVLRAIRDDSGKPVDFEVVESNSKGSQLLGYSREAAKGCLIGQLLPSIRENGDIERYAAIMNSGQVSEEEYHVSPGGFQQVWFKQRVIPLRDGVAVFATDVSQARRADETADRARRMFERIAGTTPDALILWDVETKRFIYSNRNLLDLLGLGGADTEFTSFSIVEQLVIKPDLEPLRAYAHELANSSEDKVYEAVFHFMTLEGRKKHMLFRSSVFERKSGGQPKTVLTSCQDATEQLAHNSDLEEKMEELKQARLELEQRQYELVGLNSKLSEIAMTDGLTGIKNRRAFEEKLDEEVERAQRYNSRLAMVMADVDHFKRYNDTYGHPAGDQALKAFAQVLVEVCRRSDTIARYGGEEFAIILPNTGAEEAGRLGERIRANLSGTSYGEQGLTASVGCSEYRAGKEGKERMRSEADQALYQSKNGGRDRVTVFKD